MHRQLNDGPTLLTYKDYQRLPDDGRRYEVLAGELLMSPSPQTLHQRVLLNLGFELHAHVRRRKLGEIFLAPYDVVLTTHDIVSPDLIFVANANRSIVTAKNIRGIPDLLIEIVSPNRPALDTRRKKSTYERCGVPNYWILDPVKQSLIEYVLADGAYRARIEKSVTAVLTPLIFPKLKLQLDRIWA